MKKQKPAYRKKQGKPGKKKVRKNMAKTIIDGQELNEVTGGNGGSGYNMTVGDCGGGYLALRPQPTWDQYHELAQLYPGYSVFTYGAQTSGTGLNGTPCTYTYVCWNGMWGWVNSAFIR